MDIVLATKNRKKIEEIKKILDVMGTAPRILTLDDFPNFQDVTEDGETFEENAVKKAVAISRSTGMAAVADDSGLEVDALNGGPGVFSARFAGDTADDKANLEKLLQELKTVPDEKRGARFVCCIALASGKDVKTFFGTVKGRIGTEPRGDNGFGYDPVFYPEGHDRTFAEMSDSEKNSMSHREAALKEFRKYLFDKRGRNEQED
jgi:XTP/dITP diphosphohydrolase